MLLDTAPSDFVTANRTVLSEGDRVIPLTGIWRAARFPDPAEQAKLQALSDAIDERRRASTTTTTSRSQYTTAPKGVPAADLDDGPARDAARAAGHLPRPRARPRSRRSTRYDDDAALDAVHVAWAGPTEPGAPHYYRLQGPRLLIEWDNTQRGANHAHSVWRDPAADFGLDVLTAHRAAHH